MLRFEPVAFHDDADARYGAVIVTSANALRGIEPHLAGSRLLKLPLFAVGEHTAAAARGAGFENVIAADGDAAALRDLVLASVKAKALKKASPLLYLAGADLARDLAGELGERGFTVVTHTTYRMAPVAEPAARDLRRLRRQPDRGGAALFAAQRARLPGGGARGRRRNIGAGDPAMLHFRRASPPWSATPGPAQVMVAASPDENALFEALDRALRPLIALRPPCRIWSPSAVTIEEPCDGR